MSLWIALLNWWHLTLSEHILRACKSLPFAVTHDYSWRDLAPRSNASCPPGDSVAAIIQPSPWPLKRSREGKKNSNFSPKGDHQSAVKPDLLGDKNIHLHQARQAIFILISVRIGRGWAPTASRWRWWWPGSAAVRHAQRQTDCRRGSIF